MTKLKRPRRAPKKAKVSPSKMTEVVLPPIPTVATTPTILADAPVRPAEKPVSWWQRVFGW